MEQIPPRRLGSPFQPMARVERHDSSGDDLSDSGTAFKNTYKSLRSPGLPGLSTLKLPSILPASRDPPSPKSPSFDWDFSFKERDEVYEPDVDQMVETLTKVAMNNAGKPLPAQYNSFLLHALSGYRKLKAELQAEKEARCDDLEKWVAERDTYEAEKKRLEELLVKHLGGLGGMALKNGGSLLHKGEQDQGSGETAEEVPVARGKDKGNELGTSESTLVAHGNDNKGNQLGKSRILRRNTWKQDVRVSRLFLSGEGPTTLPAGTIPSPGRAVGFGTMDRQGKDRVAPLTSTSPVRSVSAPEASSENQGSAMEKERLLAGYLDSSSESSDSGKEPNVSIETSQEDNETAVPTEGLTDVTAQPKTPLKSENEHSPASKQSKVLTPARLAGSEYPGRDTVEDITNLIHHGHVSGPSATSGEAELPVESASVRREEEKPQSKPTDGRHRGFSFSPGDDAGASYAHSMLPDPSNAAQRNPDDGNGSHLTRVISTSVREPITPQQQVTRPESPSPFPFAGYRMRPRRSLHGRPEQTQGHDRSPGGTSNRLGRPRFDKDHPSYFSVIAASRALIETTSRTTPSIHPSQGSMHGRPETMSRTAGTVTGRRATESALDPQGRANRPLGCFPAFTGAITEVTDTLSPVSLGQAEEQSTTASEEGKKTPSKE